MKRRLSGFTLMEIMITVVMVGAVAAISLPSYQKAIGKQNSNRFKFQMRNLHFALENYKAQNRNKFPSGELDTTELKDLLNLSELDTGWRKLVYTGADDGSTYTIEGKWNRIEYEEVVTEVPGQDEPLIEFIKIKTPVAIKMTPEPFSDEKTNPNPCCVQCPSLYRKCP